MKILQFSKELIDDMMAVQKEYESKYPLAERFRPDDLKNPLLNRRRNILLAKKGERIVGFSKFLSRQNFSKNYFHHIWLDIKTLCGGSEDIMDMLLEASLPLIRESTASFFSSAGTRICVRIHQSEAETESFFTNKGFEHMVDFIYMERNLEEEVSIKPSPEGVYFSLWKPKKEPEILKYLLAEQSCFRDAPLEYRYLNYFFRRPEWKRNGVLLTAFDRNNDIAGSVMIYPENDTTYHTEEVFVTEKWRNKGLAKALIAEALNYLKSKGIKSALLSVTSNRTIAMKIYSDCGYKTTLTRKVMIKTI